MPETVNSSDRPRERASRLGVLALSDSELLAVLLANAGVRGSTVGDLARSLVRSLVREFGSLSRLSTASLADLTRLAGIGPAKAATICSAFVLGRRATHSLQPGAAHLGTSSAIAAAAAAPLLLGRYERLVVLSADNRGL